MSPLDENEDPQDSELLAELWRMISYVDPVPPELLTIAEASLILHTIDADLAALTYDSALDNAAPALVRGPAAVRMFTFEAPGLVVELEMVNVGGRRRLVGQFVPAQHGVVEVRHRGGVAEIAADSLGRFEAAGIESGPVSLRCRAEGSTDPVVVDTDWFVA